MVSARASRTLIRLFVAVFAVLAGCCSVRAQQSGTQQAGSSSSGNYPPTDQNTQNQTGTNAPDSTTDTSAEDAARFQVARLGSAQWLTPGERSPVHLGPIYLDSASVFFLATDSLQTGPTPTSFITGTDYLGVLRASVNFDKLTRNGRITIQYLPDVTIVAGHVDSNLSNVAATLTMSRAVGRRGTVIFENAFSSVNGQILYGDLGLDVNSVSGNGVQNPFLQTSQRWISDTATVTATYGLTARDQLVFAPYFQYEHSNLTTLPNNLYTYGGTVTWTHLLSATKTVGLYVQINERDFSSTFPQSIFTSYGATFSDRLSRTWIFHASVAASNGIGRGQGQWTATGNVTLRKDFSSSWLALDYYRGLSTGPLLTNGYTSRADATYNQRLGRQWLAIVGTAYQTDSLSGGLLSGVYSTGQLSYRLSRNFSIFGAYARRWQDQDLPGIPSTSSFSSAGISWGVGDRNGRYVDQ